MELDLIRWLININRSFPQFFRIRFYKTNYLYGEKAIEHGSICQTLLIFFRYISINAPARPTLPQLSAQKTSSIQP
jgi:hypothetical protein